jgi:hypothetical protein
VATPSIRGNPTAEHAGGNACVVSAQDNVEKSDNPAQINCQDKNAICEECNANHCKIRKLE